MIKLKIDDAKYTLLNQGPVVSVMYRLNGVKVFGEDLEVKVCDFIEAKKEERQAHEREVARKNSGGDQPSTPPQGQEDPNVQGTGMLHPGGHEKR